MPSARTTETLVTNAVNAARAAGIVVGAVEVEKGGLVRVVALEAMKPLRSSEGGNTCDKILEGLSD